MYIKNLILLSQKYLNMIKCKIYYIYLEKSKKINIFVPTQLATCGGLWVIYW